MGDRRWRRRRHQPAVQPGHRLRHRQGLTRTSRDGGQAAVETALVLPVVVLLLCGLIEVALVARDQLSVELAAREAARAASVSAAPATAASAAAHGATTLRPLAVTTSTGAGTVSVTVSYDHRVGIPLISALIDDVDLRATATMTWEPP